MTYPTLAADRHNRRHSPTLPKLLAGLTSHALLEVNGGASRVLLNEPDNAWRALASAVIAATRRELRSRQAVFDPTRIASVEPHAPSADMAGEALSRALNRAA